MTQRERQILQWIEENPMISQEELAQKAGISRSSIAVHISNLMKKGYIAGKGYVLRSGHMSLSLVVSILILAVNHINHSFLEIPIQASPQHP